MSHIPIIPHGGSGEEEEIIQRVCPSETDFLYGDDINLDTSEAEEIHSFENENDYLHRRSCESLSESRTIQEDSLHDAFFAYMRSIEEQADDQNWDLRVQKMRRKEAAAKRCASKSPVSYIYLEHSIEEQPEYYHEDLYDIPNTLNTGPRYSGHNLSHVEKQASHQMNQIIQKRNRATEVFKKEIRNYLKSGQQSSFLSLVQSISSDSNDTSYSLASALANVSYDNSSIMKLKARKRRLENHLNESINEVRMNDLASRSSQNMLIVS